MGQNRFMVTPYPRTNIYREKKNPCKGFGKWKRRWCAPFWHNNRLRALVACTMILSRHCISFIEWQISSTNQRKYNTIENEINICTCLIWAANWKSTFRHRQRRWWCRRRHQRQRLWLTMAIMQTYTRHRSNELQTSMHAETTGCYNISNPNQYRFTNTEYGTNWCQS